MTETRKAAIHALLKGIETGDPEAVRVVNEDEYIQHNPQTREGNEGLAALFKRISASNPKVNIVRLFSDGDYVFGHTEYDFATRRIGFEVFRFEGEQAVEHWDNIQPRIEPTASGRTMVDGPTLAGDLPLTEANRALVQQFVEDVLIAARPERIGKFVAPKCAQHSPAMEDGIGGIAAMLSSKIDGAAEQSYTRLHRILAEGSFVLAVIEGLKRGEDASFYMLFRVADGLISEQWQTSEIVPPRDQWLNQNGKF